MGIHQRRDLVPREAADCFALASEDPCAGVAAAPPPPPPPEAADREEPTDAEIVARIFSASPLGLPATVPRELAFVLSEAGDWPSDESMVAASETG